MERSILWATEGIGDGRSDGYNQDDATQWQQMLWNQDPTTEGYAAQYLNELAITNPAGTTVRMASGGGVVYGFPYRNTSNVDFTPFTPTLGNTGWRVVLRTDWTLRTVRGVLLQSADGVAAYPALTQTAGFRWEISLARGTITNGGAVTVDIDDRTPVGSGGRWIVGPGDIADRTRRLWIPATGGWNAGAAAAITVELSGAYAGWVLVDVVQSHAIGFSGCPADYFAGMIVSAVVTSPTAGNQQFRIRHDIEWEKDTEVMATHSVTTEQDVVVVGQAQNVILPLDMSAIGVEFTDAFHHYLWRNGAHGGDTSVADLIVLGWLIEYTADS